MEQEYENQQSEQEAYKPRPKWQVWGARILLVGFIFLLIMYYTNLISGGI